MFNHDELATLRDACKKRIERAEQKIKYWNANPDKPQQPGIQKLNQLVAKIDLQCKPVNKI